MVTRQQDDRAHFTLTLARSYLNKGPQITERLETFWQIIGQQVVLRFDQAQRWPVRLSPATEKLLQPDMLSAERTCKILRPWIQEGVLLYKVFQVGQKGVMWLTHKGLKYANLNLRYHEPTPASLPHVCAVNDIRLLIAEHRPQELWRSEREFRQVKEQR